MGRQQYARHIIKFFLDINIYSYVNSVFSGKLTLDKKAKMMYTVTNNKEDKCLTIT